MLAWGAVVEPAHHPPRVGFWPTVAAVLRERALVSVTQQFPVRLSFLSPLAALATADRVPDAALEFVISAVPAAELEPIEVESYDDLVAARARNPAEIPPEELPNLPGAEAAIRPAPRACLDVVHGLTSPIAEQRREWARTVTQWAGAGRFDDDEAATIGTILAWAVQVEHGDARVATADRARRPGRPRPRPALGLGPGTRPPARQRARRVRTGSAVETGRRPSTRTGRTGAIRRDPLAAVRVRAPAGTAAVTWRGARTVGPERCLSTLHWMTCSDPGVGTRERALRMICGTAANSTLREGRAVAWVASWATVVETGRCPAPPGQSPVSGPPLSIRSRFLRSLSNLTEDGWVPVGALDLLASATDRSLLPPDQAVVLDHVLAARPCPAQPLPDDDDERPPPDPTPLDDRPNLPGARPGEPLGPRAALGFVRGLTHPDPPERTVAAQALAWAVDRGGVDDDEAARLAVITAWAVRVEGAGARVPLLSALVALASRDRVPPWALEQVLVDPAPADLDEAERCLRQDLAAALAGHRERAR